MERKRDLGTHKTEEQKKAFKESLRKTKEAKIAAQEAGVAEGAVAVEELDLPGAKDVTMTEDGAPVDDQSASI